MSERLNKMIVPVAAAVAAASLAGAGKANAAPQKGGKVETPIVHIDTSHEQGNTELMTIEQSQEQTNAKFNSGQELNYD